MTVAVLVAMAVLVFGSRLAGLVRGWDRGRRGKDPTSEGDQLLLAELTALGLSAGLSFSAALTAATGHLPDVSAREVRRALRSEGGTDEGVAKDLFVIADRALVTGAPLLASIDGYALSLRRDERASAVELARRLPVKLLFPLALLILPGFLLLTVGPAVLAGIDRLGL